jgi:hypothetical protein
MMQAYKFNTVISENGNISLPIEPILFNTEVEVIILPKNAAGKSMPDKKQYSALDFLKDWSGILKNMPDDEIENAKFSYLTEKHK